MMLSLSSDIKLRLHSGDHVCYRARVSTIIHRIALLLVSNGRCSDNQAIPLLERRVGRDGTSPILESR